MPYVPRSGTVQATDQVDVGVQDVYHSPNVYVNKVAVALWEPPILGDSILSALNIPPPPPVTDAPTIAQQQNFNAAYAEQAANPGTANPVSGGGGGQPGTMGGAVDAIASGTTDPNDSIGNPETVGPQVTVEGGSQWAALENKLNAVNQEAAGGAWKERTPQGSVAPNYPFNPNILAAFQMAGHPKNVLDRGYPGPGACGDNVPWCAAFVAYILANCGIPYLKALNASAYTVKWAATRPPPSDPRTWRRNDLIHLSGQAQGYSIRSHVTFVRSIKGGMAYCTGGNQSNNVNTTPYPLSLVRFVGRAWTIPADQDKPLI